MYAHAFGSFSKLTEHSWISNPLVNSVYSLIFKSAKKVAWIGDYAEEAYDSCGEAYTKAMPFDEFHRFYELAWGDNAKELSPGLFSNRDLSILDFSTKDMFLVNHDREAYIDMPAYIRENTTRGGIWDGYCMDPLPLLTACGNGRGGGDFHESGTGYENIGIWAFEYLEYTDKIPQGYIEQRFYFNENKEVSKPA